jgi:hypothetical protein
MKYRHIFWAIILIAVGVLAILGNFGVIHFSWLTVWRLWPLILILWGVSILPLKDTVKFVLLIGVLIMTFAFYNKLEESAPWYMRLHGDRYHGYSDDDWNDEGDNDSSTSKNFNTQHFIVPFDSLTGKCVLNLDAGVGNFTITDTTGQLLSFDKTGYIGNYELTTSGGNERRIIRVKMHDATIKNSVKESNVIIRLNEKPLWKFDFSVGAASMNIDLSKYRVDSVKINAGASSMDLRLGDLSPETHVSFSAGASSFTVKIPRSSGCQINSDSFLASREYEGFEKKGEHTYQTPGFASAGKKIYIKVETAVSKVRVERY